MRTSNPMLTDKAFEKAAAAARGERVGCIQRHIFQRGERSLPWNSRCQIRRRDDNKRDG
ncbi:MAG: hypothetical protein LRY51_18540 [Geovibrio sp.]|nr:hypothetical protein [Geovibrio sp.]